MLHRSLQSRADHILQPIEVADEIGERSSRFYLVDRSEERSIVTVPLMRNMTEDEIDKMLKKWHRYFSDDYTIESSTPFTAETSQTIEVEEDVDDIYDNKDLQSFHFTWLQNMVEAGWRYGNKYSKAEKVHPMLLAWEQLPRNYKETYSSILTGILDRTK